MSIGAIYICTQDSRYTQLLLDSAASLKRAMPDLPITVFSQFPLESVAFESVIRVDGSEDGFYDKTLLMQRTPYERTLFIDADIYVAEPVPELFTILDQFDFAATHEEYLNTDWWNRYPRPDIPASFPEFNTGILAYKRSPRMDRVLQDWSRLYSSFLEEHPGQKINDQPFFRAAVYRNEARIATLTREYNCKFRGQGYLNKQVKMFHGHVDLKLERAFVQKAIDVINASSKPRVYIAGTVYEQKLVGRILDRRKPGFVGRFPLLPEPVIVAGAKRLRQMLKERGARTMFLKLIGRGKKTGPAG
ncbi:MAG: hypothetical protein WBD45_19825 [Terriglobales bacterium]